METTEKVKEILSDIEIVTEKLAVLRGKQIPLEMKKMELEGLLAYQYNYLFGKKVVIKHKSGQKTAIVTDYPFCRYGDVHVYVVPCTAKGERHKGRLEESIAVNDIIRVID
jgi:hypothetical protein